MYYFDRIEEKNINGIFEVYAINEKENQAYLLREIIIQTSVSYSEGPVLKIGRRGDIYVYRNGFKTNEDMEKFEKEILVAIREAEKKNIAI